MIQVPVQTKIINRFLSHLYGQILFASFFQPFYAKEILATSDSVQFNMEKHELEFTLIASDILARKPLHTHQPEKSELEFRFVTSMA